MAEQNSIADALKALEALKDLGGYKKPHGTPAGADKATMITNLMNQSGLGLNFRQEGGVILADISERQAANLGKVYSEDRDMLGRAGGTLGQHFDISENGKQFLIKDPGTLVELDIKNFASGKNGHSGAFKAILETGDLDTVKSAFSQKLPGIGTDGKAPPLTGMGALGALAGALLNRKPAAGEQPAPQAPAQAASAPAAAASDPTVPAPAQAAPAASTGTQDKVTQAASGSHIGMDFERVDGKVVAKLTPEEVQKVGAAMASLSEGDKKKIFGDAKFNVNDKGQLEFSNADDMNSGMGFAMKKFAAGNAVDRKIRGFVEAAKKGEAPAAPATAPEKTSGIEGTSPDFGKLAAAGYKIPDAVNAPAAHPSGVDPVAVAKAMGGNTRQA